MKPLTEQLLALTDQHYDNYNTILPQIKTALGSDERREAFERILQEELPLTTVRRAYRTAIKVAMEEVNVFREWRPAEMLAQKFGRR